MEEKDFIKDLFQEKLSGLETPVRPELWSAVSSSIGASAASTGVSLLTKWIIGLSLAAGTSGIIWYAVSDESEKTTSKNTKSERVQEKNQDVESKENIKSNAVLNSEYSKDNSDNLIIPEITTTSAFLELKELNSNLVNTEDSFTNSNLSLENKSDKEIISTPSETKTEVTKMHSEVNKLTEHVLPQLSELKISMPNVFTPNGDGSNDYLSIPELDVRDFSLVVLDESGKTVYTTTDLGFNWDGTLLNGEKAPAGNYVYFITAKDSQGKSVTKYSQLNIRY
jgi:gliding motility-associated-like protein